jgi:hypothetical protein
MTRHRMVYAERRLGDTGRYVVVTPAGVREQFDSKVDAIVRAQRGNGYEPVDGSERTYVRQVNEDGRR